MLEPAGKGGGQALDRVGVELDICPPAVALLVGRAAVGNAGKALRTGAGGAARERAGSGRWIGNWVNAAEQGAIGGRGVGDRRTEQRPDRPRLEVARADLELLLAMLGADRHRQRLGEPDPELPRQIEVEQVLGVAQSAGVEVALAVGPERGVQAVMDLIIEAVVATSGGKVGSPAHDVAANADRAGIILQI